MVHMGYYMDNLTINSVAKLCGTALGTVQNQGTSYNRTNDRDTGSLEVNYDDKYNGVILYESQ